MDVEQVVDHVTSLGGVLTLRPAPGDGTPEIAWGDVFFYYSPDGTVPAGQPFATVVTKRYPDEGPSALDEPGVFRLNIAVGRGAGAVLDEQAHGAGRGEGGEPVALDTWMPHPVYGELGWVAVMNPGERTTDRALELLRTAHAAARARHERRDEIR